MLETIQAINQTAAFNRWAGFEVTRKQVFTAAELLAESDDGLKLVATGSAILVPVEATAAQR